MKPKLLLIICVLIIMLMLIRNCNTTPFCKMTNAVCESYNKSWATIDMCRLRAISRNVTTLNIRINLLQPANIIDVKLELKTKVFGYRPSIFDYTLDACVFIQKRQHRIFKLFWHIFKEFSTINHTCPYEGMQIIKDFYYDPTNLTLPVPTGDYVLLLTWIFDKKPQFITNVHFSYYQDISKV